MYFFIFYYSIFFFFDLCSILLYFLDFFFTSLYLITYHSFIDRVSILISYFQKWYSELIDLLKGMMDFSMFLELHFLFLSLSTILLFTWFIVPYFYLAEHLTRNSYTESDAANLLSIIGITNTIGMVLLILFINSFQYVSNLIFNMFSDWSWMGGRSTLDECEQNLHLVSSCLWCGNIFNVNIYSLLQFVDDYLSSVWSLLRE